MSLLRKLGNLILRADLSVDAGPAYTCQRNIVTLTNGTLTAITDAPPAGQIVVIDDLLVSSDADVTLDLTEETSNALVDRSYLVARSKIQLTPRGYLKAKQPTAGKKIQAQLSDVANVCIHCTYHFETP